MTCDLTWLTSPTTSVLHACRAMEHRLPWVDSILQEDLATRITRFLSELASLPSRRSLLWSHIVPLSSGIRHNRELIEVSLRKTLGAQRVPESIVVELSNQLNEIENSLLTQLTDLDAETNVRIRPLREQWDARGPGLLKRVGELTDVSLLVASADVIVVHPFLGGGGESHLDYNSVRIEGVLTNPHEDLPEITRLAWLLAQLNNDLPMHNETIHADRFPLISNLAMLPPVLVAGTSFELTEFTTVSIQRALDAWHVVPERQDEIAAAVFDWWNTYHASRPKWNIALSALDRMIA